MLDFINHCNSSPGNRQYGFWDGHDSHFCSRAMTKLEDNNCDSFFLKSGDSENDQPNDNGPNACLKSCYDEEMEKWNMEWGTTTYNPAHMNKVLAATWLKFQLRAPPIIVKAFAKTRLLPLLPPDKDKNLAGGAMTAAM